MSMFAVLICDSCDARPMPSDPNIPGPIPYRDVMPEGWTGNPRQQVFCPKCSLARKLAAERA